jgi:hypothetical protein
MTGAVWGMYPLWSAPLIKMRREGFIPKNPIVITMDVLQSSGNFIEIGVPDGFRPYKMNFAPVAGLDCIIVFARKTSHVQLFETYQALVGVDAKSIVAKLQGSDLYFHLKVSDDASNS